MIAHHAEADKAHDLQPLVTELLDHVHQAARQGTPAHEVEKALWGKVLALGHQALGLFFRLQGTGDLGETVELPDGQTARRLEQTHERPYRSVFGDFTLDRAVYGTREGQKIDFVPLDARLQLPASDYSYLLQQWDAALGCESAFPRSRPTPASQDEGEVMVVQADGKGVVLRRAAGCAPILEHCRKGPKKDQKRMAVVGAVYSVGRLVRTPEEVVESLFRDPREEAGERPRRP